MENEKKRGRPREFDPEVALAKATDTFMRYGYAAASLEMLTRAMGMNKPSLYAAFGDKRALFLRVIEHRGRVLGARYRVAFDRGATLQESLRALFEEALQATAGREGPPGCLIASASTTEAVEDEAIRDFTRGFFALSDKVIAGWIASKLAPGGALGAEAIGRLANGVLHDIALRARVNESRTKLREIARDAALALARAAGEP